MAHCLCVLVFGLKYGFNRVLTLPIRPLLRAGWVASIPQSAEAGDDADDADADEKGAGGGPDFAEEEQGGVEDLVERDHGIV